MFKRNYAADPGLADRVFDLLEVTFPGVGQARDNGIRFGATWESVSTPFVVRDGDRVLAHVGLMAMPLVVAGRPIVVGGVHGVATDPAVRRRGYFRGLIEELLADTAARFPTLILTTLHRKYFEPFGFRVVPESIFRARVASGSGHPTARTLDLADPSDHGLMHRLLASRAPVSTVLGVGAEKACWAFYEYRSPIRYLPELDVAVIAVRRGRTLALYDVVGPAMPSLERILAGLGESVDEVVTYFSPDRLDAAFRSEPHDLTGGPEALEPGERDFVFMVRGPFAADGPLMLPRPARC